MVTKNEASKSGRGFLAGFKATSKLTSAQVKKAKFIRAKGVGVIGVKVNKKVVKFSETRKMSAEKAGKIQGFIKGVELRKRRLSLDLKGRVRFVKRR